MTENRTEIAYHSTPEQKTHLIIYTNSTVRNALSKVFRETWVLHSIPLGRSFVFPVGTQICLLFVTLLLKERLESHLRGKLAPVIKNVAMKTRVSLDQNRFPHLFEVWSAPPVNEQESLALQNSVRRSVEVSQSASFCGLN